VSPCWPGKFVGTLRPLREMISQTKFRCDVNNTRRAVGQGHLDQLRVRRRCLSFVVIILGHTSQMLLFSLQFGELKFREPPPQAFYHRALRRRCNASGARHPSIRRMRLGRPASVLPSGIAPFSLRLTILPTARLLSRAGSCVVCSALKAGKISSRIRGTKPSFTFAKRMSLFVFVNAHKQRTEPVRAGTVTTDNESLFPAFPQI
jgi:hypothetical protein